MKTEFNFKKINSKLVALNIVLLVGFFVSQIAVTSLLGTKTQEIDQIRQAKKDIRLQNELLISEIDKLKTFAEVEEIKSELNLSEKEVTLVDNPGNEDVAIGN